MKKRIPRLLIGVILVLIILFSLPLIFAFGMPAYGEFDKWRYQEKNEFIRAKWDRNPKYRFSVIDYVSESVVNTGMMKEEVSQALGEPDYIYEDGSWQYESDIPGWRWIDFSGGGLNLTFDSQQQLTEATNNTWID
tara:strand:- start:451 stop:858 length:408 start_codon:yes stop_codon:yes gene_type:complete